ncbi:MAG TPA: hypothetical protein VGB77_23065 [Abditibacteriaceae bacterium]|jgi:hypothetical protein
MKRELQEAKVCPACGDKFFHNLTFCDDCGKRLPWAPSTLTEKEIDDLFLRLYYVGPLWLPPFDMEDDSEWAKFYEDKVQSDLWGNFELLIAMISRAPEKLWSSSWQTHLSDLLGAICRLAPEQYFQKVTPLLEKPELREELIWSAGQNFLPQTIEWLKPWVSRLTELSDKEINTIIEIIGLVGAEQPELCAEGQSLLQQIRDQISEEHTPVHHALDWYSDVLSKHEKANE